MNKFSLKQHHFISMAQTKLGMQLLREVGPGGEISFVTDEELLAMERIYDAAERIPADMTAFDAASLFALRERGNA